MTNLETLIVSSYETCGMAPDEIAESEDLEVTAIKACLLTYSPEYRAKTSSGEETQDITKQEYQEFLTVYKNLARYAEQENVQERSCKFLINEFKGRNDGLNVIKSLKAGTIQFNQIIVQAREQRKKLEERVKGEVVDV